MSQTEWQFKPLLPQRCATIAFAGPSLKQQWASISRS